MMRNAFIRCVLFAALPMVAVAAPMVYNLTSPVYEPYLTTQAKVIWQNRSLEDLYQFSAEMKGGWIGATPASPLIYDRTDTRCMVQFQAIGGSDCKIVVACFEQSGDDIVGWACLAGYVGSGNFGRVVATNLLGNAKVSDGTSQGYGVHLIGALGDARQTIDALPDTADGIVISGGVLQVNVAADTVVTQKVSGTGGLRFTGDNQLRSRPFTFDKFLTTSDQVVCYNASYLDVSVVSGVLNGSSVSKTSYPCLAPYNVTTNLDDKSITLQLQGVATRYNNRYGFVVRFAQDSTNVVARAILTRKAGVGQEIGSDVNSWTGYVAIVATSATTYDYGVERMELLLTTKAIVRMTGEKEFTGGLAADGCAVHVCDSQLPNKSHMRAVNGGVLRLDLPFTYGYNTYNSYYVDPDSEIQTFGGYSINRSDRVEVNGGSIYRASTRAIYINELELRNGGCVRGCVDVGACNVPSVNYALWVSRGTRPNVVADGCRIIRINGYPYPLILQTETDITFAKKIYEYSNPDEHLEGMPIIKQGPAKATFEGGIITTGQVTVVEGTMDMRGTSTLGPLCVQGNATMVVAAGAKVTFADSHTTAWTSGVKLNLTGAFGPNDQTMRFGTSSDGLTPAQQRAMRVNGLRCRLDSNGWLHEYRSGFFMVYQ